MGKNVLAIWLDISLFVCACLGNCPLSIFRLEDSCCRLAGKRCSVGNKVKIGVGMKVGELEESVGQRPLFEDLLCAYCATPTMSTSART